MAKKITNSSNEVHQSPAGIINWQDQEWTKMQPMPGEPDGSFSIDSSGGGKANVGQLRGLIDSKKGK